MQSETATEVTRLVRIVDEDGEIQARGGIAGEMDGCTDDEGRLISGGWDESGNFHCSSVWVDGRVLTPEGKLTNFNADGIEVDNG